MRSLTSVLATALLLSGCKSRETDEALLQKKIDTVKVHVYVGAKATLADNARDDELRKLRASLIKVILSKDTNAPADEVSISALGALARQVWRLRQRGADLVRAGKDHPPILPVLTAGKEKIDANAEHCLLMAALLTAKFHPRVPVPVPDELILYEASRCVPGQVAGVAAPLHAVRAFAFARSELCDLAARETTAAFGAPDHGSQLQKVLATLTRGAVGAKQAQTFSAGLESLSYGAGAVCFVRRGERERAHESLGKMLDAAEKAGLKTAEVDLLRAYLECSKDKKQAKQGLARLEKLGKRGDLSKQVHADVEHLSEYCKTSAGTSSKLLRKIAVSRLAMRIAMQHAEQAGATARLDQDALYRSIRRLGAVSGALSRLADGEKVKDSVKGLLRRVRE